MPHVTGHLLGKKYAVVYGVFNWIEWTSSSNLFVVDLLPPYQGRVTAITPSVWGQGVFAAAWHEEDVSFYVVGNFDGLDGGGDQSVRGIARCYTAAAVGCFPVDQGLPNPPHAELPPILSWVGETLFVSWQTEPPSASVRGSVTMLGQWSADESWSYKALPKLGSVGGDFESVDLAVTGGTMWLLFPTGPLGSMHTLLCDRTKYGSSTVASFFWGYSSDWSNGCWSTAVTNFSFNDSRAATTSDAVYRLSTEAVVVRLAASPSFTLSVTNVNYNLPADFLQLDTLFLVASKQRVFISSWRGGAIWYLDDAATQWRLAVPQVCDAHACHVRNLVPSTDGTLLSWLPPLPMMLENGTLTIQATDSEAPFQSLVSWQYLSAAPQNVNFCVASEYVLFLGDFHEIAFDNQRIATPYTALWDISSGVWSATPLTDATLGHNTCFTHNNALWVLSVGHMGDGRHVSVLIARFAQGQWSIWRPQLANSELVPLLGRLEQGISIVNETLYMVAMVRSSDNETTTTAVFGWDMVKGSSAWYLAANVTSELWDGWLLGQVVWRDSLWLFGKFVIPIDGILQRNMIRVDLLQGKATPIFGAKTDNPNVDSTLINCMVVANPLSGLVLDDMLWAGGLFYEVPGIDDVNNFAALASNGSWVYATAKLNGPPSYATVTSMITDPQGSFIVMVSTVSPFDSGMIFFRRGEFDPPQLSKVWVDNVNAVKLVGLVDVDALWILWLMGLVTVSVLLSVSVGILSLWRMDKRRAFKYIEIPDYASHGVRTNMDAILRDVDVTKLDASEVELGEIIGQGGQAQVVRATYRGQDVAAKAVFGFSSEAFSSFAKEIKLTSAIKHPNIVSFIGAVLKDERMWLLTELMDADLASLSDQLDPYSKMTVTQDVAKAMDYLHSFVPPVLHRDLKASNVLISRDGRVKLADFGVSRLMTASSEQSQMTKDAGTLLYMAPEQWESVAVYGTPADVYSFGLLIVECWTGKNPFHPFEFTWILDFVERVRNKEVVPGVNKMPDYTPDEVREVAIQCLNWDASLRPSFKRIVKLLNKGTLMDNMAGTASRLARAAQQAGLGLDLLMVDEQLPPDQVAVLTGLAARMRDPAGGVPIQDRRWYVKTYPACFIGSEAVDWLMQNQGCVDRAAACKLGMQMQVAGLLAHVTRDHTFKDGMFFYRFTIDELERSGSGSRLFSRTKSGGIEDRPSSGGLLQSPGVNRPSSSAVLPSPHRSPRGGVEKEKEEIE